MLYAGRGVGSQRSPSSADGTATWSSSIRAGSSFFSSAQLHDRRLKRSLGKPKVHPATQLFASPLARNTTWPRTKALRWQNGSKCSVALERFTFWKTPRSLRQLHGRPSVAGRSLRSVISLFSCPLQRSPKGAVSAGYKAAASQRAKLCGLRF